jgi:nicotinamide-nucleotide amidase
MTAEILCVGTELLLGDIVNTNAAFMSKELALAGINVFYQSVVGDNPERLLQSLRLALSRSDTVVTSGGLGPTYDDITKETAAKCFELELKLVPELLEELQEIFRRMGRRPMTSNNKKQAVMPEGAHVFKNRNGTAPGLAIEREGKKIIMLPGPPNELEPMFVEEVLPWLRKNGEKALVSHNINIFGLGESAVEDILRDKMENYKNPSIAPYAKTGEVLLRVTALAGSREEAEELIRPVLLEIKESAVGKYIYGIDSGSLQNALVKILSEKKLVFACAESCSGGLVSARLTEIPGASEIFGYGICTYSNEAKVRFLGVNPKTLEIYGAVSAQTAAEMAAGIRAVSGADIGISITGIAGPGGGSLEKPVGLVYIGVDSNALTKTQELRLAKGYLTDRNLVRYLSASHALRLAIEAANLHD